MPLDVKTIERLSPIIERLTGAAWKRPPKTDDETELRDWHKELAGRYRSLDAALRELEGAFGEQTRVSGFDTFLTQVGEAAIKTQKNLDEQNLKAIVESAEKGTVPGGVFRMPRLQAEIKFALETIEKEKVGLVFYSRGTQEQSQNQQSLNFEIVSVPPPPELLSYAREIRPNLPLVLSQSQRQAIFDAIKNVQGIVGDEGVTLSNTITESHKAELTKEPDAVLIFASGQLLGRDTSSYLLLYAASDATDKTWLVGVWQLKLATSTTTQPELQILWDYFTKGSAKENVTSFKEWVRAAAEKQMVLLKSV